MLHYDGTSDQIRSDQIDLIGLSTTVLARSYRTSHSYLTVSLDTLGRNSIDSIASSANSVVLLNKSHKNESGLRLRFD